LPAANPDFVNITIIFSELEAGKKKDTNNHAKNEKKTQK
jgi:hypothetical protein